MNERMDVRTDKWINRQVDRWGGQKQEQGRFRAGARAGPGRAEAGWGRSRAEVGTRQEQGRSRVGAGQEQDRSM